MGQQQLLLVILGILIVGIAISAALGLFGAEEVEQNKEAMRHDILNISIYAKRYYLRPVTMGGGSRSFVGFTIPTKLLSTANGSYSVSVATKTDVTFVGISANHPANTITVVLNDRGKLTNYTYTGDFQ
ncbi:MAG: hypothetical protein MUF82_01170 [Bacteroidetes bacterium]|nr:hypothetical protein [Bacteroidota bacterium]